MHHLFLLKKSQVLQQGQSDCGIACLLSIIQYYGGVNSMENLRRISGTNITGTTLLGLHHAAQQCGFTAEGCEADIEALKFHQSPVILHVLIERKLQHYIVCYGSKETKAGLQFIIGDPAKGIVHLSSEELNTIWQSKACLILTPNENFVKATSIKKKKQEWIKALLKEDAPLLGIAATIGIAMAVLSLSMAFFSQRLIDDILPKRNWQKLNIGIVMLIFILLAKEGLSFLRQHFLLRQSRAFNNRIIYFFYNHLLHLPKPFFDTRKIGELTARLNDTARIQKLISQLAGNSIIDILIVIASISFLFTYSASVALVCLCVLPVFYYLVYRHNKSILQGQKAVMSRYAVTEANYISTLQGIEPIKMSSKEELFANTNKAIYGQFQDSVFSLGNIQIKLSFLANSFSVVFLCGLLWYGGSAVMHGHLKTGELMAILSLCGTILPGVANLALLTIPINEARIAFNRMFEFTSVKKEEDDENSIDIESLDSIEVSNLCFRFAGRSQLLKQVSFTLQKGKIIALVGENGCGKSTLSQILQRHYQFESGSVTINQNHLLDAVSLSQWRTICAVVPQNIHIFNGTVLENIAYEKAAHEEVIHFLQQYGFASFLDALPQSVFTIVGEEGINLSGGQKQMIALARALYQNPQLLILDEATSSMDRESEKFVIQLLSKLKNRMAILFITHRIHILKSFTDRIYVMENGTIHSYGNHVTLLNTKNLYSSFWVDQELQESKMFNSEI